MSRAGKALTLGLALMVSGCGRDPTGNSRLGRLKVWTSHNNAEVTVFRELMEEFSQRFETRRGRKLTIEVGRVAHEGLETKLKTAALSGTTPDVCRIDVAHVATLAWGQAAVRLDTTGRELFSDPAKRGAHFVEAALASNLVPVPDGKGGVETGLFGIPEQTNCLVLFRNRKLFAERADELRAAGLDPDRGPRTWDELVAYGKVLARPEDNTYAFGMKNTLWWSLPFLYSAGGRVFEPDPELVYRNALADPGARQAWQYWHALATEPYTRAGQQVTVEGGFWRAEADVHRAFIEGRLAMALTGPWSVPLFRARVPDLAASRIPAGPAGSGSTVGGSNLVVLPSCADREAALDLLEFVASDEYQLRWSRALSQIPVTTKALGDAAGEADATLRVFMEQMRTARARPTLPNFEPVEQIFQAEMELALQGRRTLDEALTRIGEKLERQVLGPLREAL